MNRFAKYSILFLLGQMILLLNSCTVEELYIMPVQEGIPTTVTLNYNVSQEQVMTRAAQSAEYENRVDNMYVFVFDSDGNRVTTVDNDDHNNPLSFFTTSNGLSVTNGDGSEGNLTKGSVTFTVGSVSNASIVGIANLTTATTATAFNVTTDDMDDIQTLDELESVVVRMEDGHTIERNALFMMTGYAKDSDGNSSFDIIGSEGGNAELGCSIELTRVDAKVVVNVTSEPADKSWTNFSFEPKTWRVMRVPAQTLLLPYDEANDKTEKGPWEDTDDKDWDYSEDDAAYFDTEERAFETMVPDENDNTSYYKGGSFTFYMPENRKHFKQKITESGPAGYALREKQDQSFEGDFSSKPGQEYKNSGFTYANPNSTYLILTGYLSYTTNGTVVNTDARYIVHLGYYFEDPNDYDTRRNGKYTYTVTVKGVNNLTVEVSNDNEVRPGYEGDIVYSNNEIYYLDSHYDRCLLKIRPADVSESMTWSIKTPFSSGVHTIGDNTYKDVEDFRWIKFAINRKFNVGHGQYVKFPGEKIYDKDWEPSNADLNNVPNLIDIDQLVKYLKLVKKTDPNLSSLKTDTSLDHVCITAFVDEFLYYYDPVEDPDQSTPKPELWHKCVDVSDRMMHIMVVPVESNGEYYSPDGNTSMLTSVYSFIQKAIRTVYDATNMELKTAWGLESVMEGEDNGYNGRLEVGDVSAASRLGEDTYNSNGRLNCLQWMINKKWTDIVQTSQRYGLNPAYNNAAYACLLRNRDLDGDDVVDAEEVRWYLASIDQLTDIFIGEWALDKASKLYPYDPANKDYPPTDKVYWHYTSSSPDPARSNYPNVLWAEEGASRGNYDNGSTERNGSYYSYRCVRNLGLPIDQPDKEPEDLVQVTDNGDGTFTMDLSRMNPKSLRTSMDGGQPLPLDNEKGSNNRPYRKFTVGKDAYGIKGADITEITNGGHTNAYSIPDNTESETSANLINDSYWNSYQNYNPCPEGYRIPSHRELLIMTSRLSSSQWPQYTVTAYYWQRTSEWGRPLRFEEEQKAKTYTLTPNYYLCHTSFSMKDIPPYRTTETDKQREGFGWIYSSDVFMLQNNRNDDVGYVRCVKDTN